MSIESERYKKKIQGRSQERLGKTLGKLMKHDGGMRKLYAVDN